MPITSKILKYIIPDSESDSNYADFEFMLVWKHRNGAYCQYLFTDWEHSRSIDAKPINKDDSDNMENLIKSVERVVTLTAEDVSLNDLEAISSILEAKKILRLYKDGTTERIGLDNNSFDYQQSGKRYNLKFNIFLYNKRVPQ